MSDDSLNPSETFMVGTFIFLAMILATTAAAQSDPWYFQTDTDIRFLVPDKAEHFWGSYMITRAVGPVPAFLVGVAYESYQASQGGFFSERDVAANALGILSAIINPHSPPLAVLWDKEQGVIILQTTIRF